MAMIPVWSGCASIYDGFVEEVHSYSEAQRADFHHSLYFSEPALERMEQEDSIFFWIDNGVINTEWRYGGTVPSGLIARIKNSLIAQGFFGQEVWRYAS